MEHGPRPESASLSGARGDTVLVAGCDGGATKTTCLLARAADGIVMGSGSAGPANIHSAAPEVVRTSLAGAVRDAFATAGLKARPLAAIVLGCAGAAREDDRGQVETLLRAAVSATRYLVVNDASIALRAALGSGSGVLLIAGTGSIGYGRDAAGREHRAGGWGFVLDDAGSGYAVGLAGLQAVVRAHDGRGAPTALTRALLDAWEVEHPAQLIGLVYRQPLPREAIAALAPVVVAAARAGDRVAMTIITQAGRDLGDLAVAVARQIQPQPAGALPLILDGGLARAAWDLLATPLRQVMDAAGLVVDARLATVSAAHGALQMARGLAAAGAPPRSP